MNSKCRICNNEEGNRSFEAREWMFGYKDVFAYFQCSKCSCLQIAEFQYDLSRYYGGDYYSYNTGLERSGIRDYLVRMKNHYAVFNSGLLGKFLFEKYPTSLTSLALRPLHFVHANRKSRILEVGCGSGSLLNDLRRLGFENLLGVDPFIEQDIEYGNGLKIRKLYVHEVQGKWDVIMFHHSFEHVPNPRETLQAAKNLLSPGGCCVVRIPTVSSYAWEHYGTDWIQLDAPRHFFLHSIESMAMLAAEAGLELDDVVHDSTDFQFWGSEQIRKGIHLNHERSHGMNPYSLFSKAEIAAFVRKAKELNEAERGDQAVFYLKRPNQG